MRGSEASACASAVDIRGPAFQVPEKKDTPPVWRGDDVERLCSPRGYPK